MSAREKVRKLVLMDLIQSVAPFIESRSLGKSSLRIPGQYLQHVLGVGQPDQGNVADRELNVLEDL